MVITFYFILSWMMVGLVIFNRKKTWGTIRDVCFLLLLTCLINTNAYLGLFDTFNWIKTSSKPKLYVSFLLFRSVFIPFFITYFVLIIVNQRWKMKLFSSLLYVLIILIIDKIGLANNLYRFKNWNLFYTLLYYIIFLLFTLIALKWFRKLKE